MILSSDPAFYCSLQGCKEAEFIHRLWHETPFRDSYSGDYVDAQHDFITYHAYSLDWVVRNVWVIFVSVDTRTSVGEIRDFAGVTVNRYFGESTYAVVARYVVCADNLRSAFWAARDRFEPEVRRWRDEQKISQITLNLDRAEMISVVEFFQNTVDAAAPHHEAAMLSVLSRLAEVIVGSGGYKRWPASA